MNEDCIEVGKTIINLTTALIDYQKSTITKGELLKSTVCAASMAILLKANKKHRNEILSMIVELIKNQIDHLEKEGQ